MRLLGGGVATVLCLLAAVGLAACGGGGSGSEFASEANAICKHAAEESLAIFRSPASARHDRQGAIELQQRYISLDEKTWPKLRALEAPASATKAFEAYVADGEPLLATERKVLKAAREGDPQKYAKLNERATEEGKAAKKDAAAVGGLGACADELPEPEAKEVAQLVEEEEMKADPAQCGGYFAEAVVKQEWKTMEGCREFQEGESPGQLPKSVDVKVTEGVGGVKATAEVTYHGGANDGHTMEYGLARQGGSWQVVYGAPKEG